MKLFVLHGCPYCNHVLREIDVTKIPGLEVISVPSDHAERTALKEASGQTFVPTLIDGEKIIADDDDAIIGYLKLKEPVAVT